MTIRVGTHCLGSSSLYMAPVGALYGQLMDRRENSESSGQDPEWTEYDVILVLLTALVLLGVMM